MAEDDAVIALALGKMLEELGAGTLKIVSRVSEGLDAVTSQRFDLAVLDVRLGDGSGLEIAARCVAQRLPFIIATAYLDVVEVAEASGFTCILKPYSLADLKGAVSQASAPAKRRGRKQHSKSSMFSPVDPRRGRR